MCAFRPRATGKLSRGIFANRSPELTGLCFYFILLGSMIYAGTASHVFSKREISAGLWTGGLSVLQRSCYLFFFFKKNMPASFAANTEEGFNALD